MTSSVPILRRFVPVALGLFVLWQLVFLPAANLIDFFPRTAKPHDYPPLHGHFDPNPPVPPAAQRAIDAAGGVLEAWSELSGQEQGWGLFAPGFPTHSVFLAAELHFADGTTAEVRSDYEATDLKRPVRMPFVHVRPYNVEARLVVPVWFLTDDTLAEASQVWQKSVPGAVRAEWRLYRAWMRVAMERYAKEHPDRGRPTGVILKARYIPTPRPGEPREWTGPITERPIARWKADDAPPPGRLPVEAFDPVGRAFVPLEPWGHP